MCSKLTYRLQRYFGFIGLVALLTACGSPASRQGANQVVYTPVPTPPPVIVVPTPTPTLTPIPTIPPVPPIIVLPPGAPAPTPPPFPVPTPTPAPRLSGPCALQITSQTVKVHSDVGGVYSDVTLKILLGNIYGAVNYRINDGGVRVIPTGLMNGPMEITEVVPLMPGPNVLYAEVRDIYGNRGTCQISYLQDYALNVSDTADVEYAWDSGFYESERVIINAGAGNSVGKWYFRTATMEMPAFVGKPRRRFQHCEENEILVGRFAGNPDSWAAANDILCRELSPELELVSETDTGLAYGWALGKHAWVAGSAISYPVLTGFQLNRNGTFGVSFAYVKWRKP